VYRVAQESLVNVVRHADAHEAHLRLGAEEGEVVLTVEDDGVGLERPWNQDGGILGMRDRALTVGGDLRIEPSPLGGAQVRLRLPNHEGARASA
jgi:two-component system sensor histidine kinase UhpB